jgi:ribonuclease VapC
LEYIAMQKYGANRAKELLESVENKPVSWHQSDKALCSAAAKLKAAHHISFADSFVAATAKRFDAVLVHKDPEFDALAGVLTLEKLPLKNVE